ncbi:uncharacterized protein METZ01_LOCUS273412, partial [marine metagenome]
VTPEIDSPLTASEPGEDLCRRARKFSNRFLNLVQSA